MPKNLERLRDFTILLIMNLISRLSPSTKNVGKLGTWLCFLMLSLPISLHASFTPADITGLRFWLDATDSSTITVNTENEVTSMTEKAQNAVLTPPDTNRRPILTSSGIGGLPSLSFAADSAPGLDSNIALDFLHQGTGFSFFAVFDATSVAGHRQVIFHTGAWSASDTGFFFALMDDNSFYMTQVRNDASDLLVGVSSPNDSASFVPTVVQYTYSYDDPTSSAAIFGFGDELASSSSSAFQPDGGSAATFPRIGSNAQNRADRSFAGLLSEMLIFEGNLTEEETQQIGFYLASKYDIQTSYVPEPGAIALLAGTLALLLAIRRRR